MSRFTGEYSRLYQDKQDCQCDRDHDRCALNNIMVNELNMESIYFLILLSLFQYSVSSNSAKNDVLKRARRVRRVCFISFLKQLKIHHY